MKLANIVEINATLLLETGLHIGAGDSEMHIGGIDNSVIKNPITNQPYIPGSSLKGKIRTLLEWRSGAVKDKPLSLNDVKNASNPEDVKNILRLFGISGDTKNTEAEVAEIGVSRLAFWDCELDPQFVKEQLDNNIPFTEAKSENTIDRITSTAGNPRQTERVPAGSKFTFKLTLRQFEGDNNELLELVLKGLRLLELDSLGGSGSRGYGKVSFKELKVNGEAKDLAQINPFK
ncbi:CRISPR type III-A/MTUBE-associated RAMP protein Csm3 [Canicola haemoglobinophilus]|uniref:CRISPR system Cms endoribonuclease Csm3 n=1 Tax=Canicola haemoglobinophilus TaxID=733 RepID=A0AB38H8L0_9PAST|nr:type III-A CRISPR-associated RAMP protein Csm3 [Canicola haemoglobinophilus]STO53529.1 CRISPR type III-A/MTUBE-associated RAMP protein Csm3 [Canicola haemoglobinophilus]STO68063.1 CRISPR type III-A/MTUBE-associated RAMP protein Csm3 [Canicola haemoglobinophilus]